MPIRSKQLGWLDWTIGLHWTALIMPRSPHIPASQEVSHKEERVTIYLLSALDSVPPGHGCAAVQSTIVAGYDRAGIRFWSCACLLLASSQVYFYMDITKGVPFDTLFWDQIGITSERWVSMIVLPVCSSITFMIYNSAAGNTNPFELQTFNTLEPR